MFNARAGGFIEKCCDRKGIQDEWIHAWGPSFCVLWFWGRHFRHWHLKTICMAGYCHPGKWRKKTCLIIWANWLFEKKKSFELFLLPSTIQSIIIKKRKTRNSYSQGLRLMPRLGLGFGSSFELGLMSKLALGLKGMRVGLGLGLCLCLVSVIYRTIKSAFIIIPVAILWLLQLLKLCSLLWILCDKLISFKLN